MQVYQRNRFRKTSMNELLETIRDSEAYNIQKEKSGDEKIQLDKKTFRHQRLKLWNGARLNSFPVHHIYLNRESPLPEINYKDSTIRDIVREEMKRIIGFDASFDPRFVDRINLFLGYDILTPKGKKAMERINLIIDRNSLVAMDYSF